MRQNTRLARSIEVSSLSHATLWDILNCVSRKQPIQIILGFQNNKNIRLHGVNNFRQ